MRAPGAGLSKPLSVASFFNRFVLVVLNNVLPAFFGELWGRGAFLVSRFSRFALFSSGTAAFVRICADGGANRVFDLFQARGVQLYDARRATRLFSAREHLRVRWQTPPRVHYWRP